MPMSFNIFIQMELNFQTFKYQFILSLVMHSNMKAQVYTINHPQEYLVNSKGTLPSGTFSSSSTKGQGFLQSEMLAMVSILLPPKSKVF
jgi:hypothetical protein